MKRTTVTSSDINVIFLDIDGVLNGYNFWNLLGWNIINLIETVDNRNKFEKWLEKVSN